MKAGSLVALFAFLLAACSMNLASSKPHGTVSTGSTVAVASSPTAIVSQVSSTGTAQHAQPTSYAPVSAASSATPIATPYTKEIPSSVSSSSMVPTEIPTAVSQVSAITTSITCSVTKPNGSTPPPEPGVMTFVHGTPRANPLPDRNYYGNGKLWTGLWPHGTILIDPTHVNSDGSLFTKFFWWRGPTVVGKLTIQGRRLDASVPPLQADIPKGYGNTGFQASSLIFPTQGCWKVTARVGNASLTFVTRVKRVKKLPPSLR